MRTIDDTEEFREYARTRDVALRDALVERHLGLSYALAGRFAGRGEDLDDLRQVAAFALVQAVERFDPTRGVAFSSFATPTIVGALKRHLRDHAWTIRPVRGVHDRYLAIASVIEELTSELRREPTKDEIACRAGWTAADVEEAARCAARRATCELDAVADSAEFGDPSTPIAYGRVEDRSVLDDLLAQLDRRTHAVVEMWFFGDLPQQNIGARIGCSQMHVSRLLARSIETMRAIADQRGVVLSA